MIFDKLLPILNKYTYKCKKKVSIMTNDEKNEFILNLLKKDFK